MRRVEVPLGRSGHKWTPASSFFLKWQLKVCGTEINIALKNICISPRDAIFWQSAFRKITAGKHASVFFVFVSRTPNLISIIRLSEVGGHILLGRRQLLRWIRGWLGVTIPAVLIDQKTVIWIDGSFSAWQKAFGGKNKAVILMHYCSASLLHYCCIIIVHCLRGNWVFQ